jgi:hypothetical protein
MKFLRWIPAFARVVARVLGAAGEKDVAKVIKAGADEADKDKDGQVNFPAE